VNLKPSPLAFVFLLAGWISRQQLIVIEYLKAENRMLRERFKGRSLRFSDRERALLARKAFGIPRKVLLELGTIVTPDTLLRWHRQLFARKFRLQPPPRARAPAHDADHHRAHRADGAGEPAVGQHPYPGCAWQCAELDQPLNAQI
jgi:hypothetical protein